MRRPHAMTLIDLLVAICLLGLLSAICLAQAVLMDTVQNRVKCASNLRVIGQALLLYASDMNGHYPRTLAEPADNPQPVWGTPYEGNDELGASTSDKQDEWPDPFVADDKPPARFKPKPNDVTAALYLLLRTEEISSQVFVCPATVQKAWDFGGERNTSLSWTNWRGNEGLRAHLSYSYQNPYPSEKATRDGFEFGKSSPREFIRAGDMNPGTDALLKLTAKSPQLELRAGNSPNHSRQGQNLLFGDGRVEFIETPFAGAKGDNIFTAGSGGEQTIIGAPASATDSILLPTARDIGLADEQGNFIERKDPASAPAR